MGARRGAPTPHQSYLKRHSRRALPRCLPARQHPLPLFSYGFIPPLSGLRLPSGFSWEMPACFHKNQDGAAWRRQRERKDGKTGKRDFCRARRPWAKAGGIKKRNGRAIPFGGVAGRRSYAYLCCCGGGGGVCCCPSSTCRLCGGCLPSCCGDCWPCLPLCRGALGGCSPSCCGGCWPCSPSCCGALGSCLPSCCGGC